ncbi:MAG: hypothetical protein KAQ62_28100, partial [Cyclobacteriaceae bacterium]|nr:hypothetical protein [Cyclobacteriaceae bacterium]
MTILYNHLAGKMNKLLNSGIKYIALLLFAFCFFAFSESNAQLSIDTEGTLFPITFDATVSGVNEGQFAGSGFQSSSPSSGRIDSDGIIVTGLSDGDMVFGSDYTTGDYARGPSNGSETTGGIYAFQVASSDYALGFQPVGIPPDLENDLTPGEIILKITNNTLVDIVRINLSYEIWEFNDQNRSTSLNFSHSPDNTTYTSVASLDFESEQQGILPIPPFSPPSWEKVDKSYSIDISASPLSNGSSFYFKWSTDDFGGSDSRDELAI